MEGKGRKDLPNSVSLICLFMYDIHKIISHFLMKNSPQGIRTKENQVIKNNETKAVIMYTVDQQITSGGPRIYLSPFSVANTLMWLDRLGMFTFSHLLPSPWEMYWNGEQFHLLWREQLEVTEVFYELFPINS